MTPVIVRFRGWDPAAGARENTTPASGQPFCVSRSSTWAIGLIAQMIRKSCDGTREERVARTVSGNVCIFKGNGMMLAFFEPESGKRSGDIRCRCLLRVATRSWC